MRTKLSLLTALSIDVIILAAFAANLWWLWAVLFSVFGIIIGLATIRGDGRTAAALCATLLAIVPGVVIVRALPIHSFDWSPITHLDRLTIERPAGAGSIEVTDSRLLMEFEAFGARGCYQTVSKCGEVILVVLHDQMNRRRLAICYDAFAGRSTGSLHTVFVPHRRQEFRRWLDRVLSSPDNVGDRSQATGGAHAEVDNRLGTDSPSPHSPRTGEKETGVRREGGVSVSRAGNFHAGCSADPCVLLGYGGKVGRGPYRSGPTEKPQGEIGIAGNVW
jgi:hypothetical protein